MIKRIKVLKEISDTKIKTIQERIRKIIIKYEKISILNLKRFPC